MNHYLDADLPAATLHGAAVYWAGKYRRVRWWRWVALTSLAFNAGAVLRALV